VSRAGVIARQEVALQAREFLTALYLALFLLLTGAFTSTHAVELVDGRGPLARNAPLVLAHAMAGVVAFGQVITTMIASTAVLRDASLRTDQLLHATALTEHEYLRGRFLGALAIMAAVYFAVPAGLALGTAVPWAPRAELLPFDAASYLRPVAVLLVPDVLAVAAIFFAVGALTRNVFAILVTGVVLVSLWQLGLQLVGTPGGAAAGGMLDPFGNAAIRAATASVPPEAQGTAALPITGLMLANRALWLGLGAAALALTWRRFRWLTPMRADTRTDGTTDRSTPVGTPHGSSASPASRTPQPPLTPTGAPATRRTPAWGEAWGRQADAWLRFTFRTTVRETGFLALAALALLNAAANVWPASAAAAGAEQDAILRAAVVNVRLFFILVGTIWAGELAWRERDLRADGLADALPAPSSAALFGKLAGVHAAQALLVLGVAVVAFVLPRLRGAPHAPSPWFTLGWTLGALLPAVVLLTAMALAVHAVVQHKVAGHVVLIAGWVVAYALGNAGTHVDALAISDVPWLAWTVTGGVTIDWTAQAREVAFALVRALGWTMLAAAAWQRGAPRPLWQRLREAGARG
jgi:hypothetical protein